MGRQSVHWNWVVVFQDGLPMTGSISGTWNEVVRDLVTSASRDKRARGTDPAFVSEGLLHAYTLGELTSELAAEGKTK